MKAPLFIYKAVILFLLLLLARITRGIAGTRAIFPSAVTPVTFLFRLLFTAFLFFHQGQGQIVERLDVNPFPDIHEQARIENRLACKFLKINKLLHVGVLGYDLNGLLVGQVHLVLDDQAPTTIRAGLLPPPQCLSSRHLLYTRSISPLDIDSASLYHLLDR